MMWALTKYYTRRGAAVIVVLALAGWGIFEALGSVTARMLVSGPANHRNEGRAGHGARPRELQALGRSHAAEDDPAIERRFEGASPRQPGTLARR